MKKEKTQYEIDLENEVMNLTSDQFFAFLSEGINKVREDKGTWIKSPEYKIWNRVTNKRLSIARKMLSEMKKNPKEQHNKINYDQFFKENYKRFL